MVITLVLAAVLVLLLGIAAGLFFARGSQSAHVPAPAVDLSAERREFVDAAVMAVRAEQGESLKHAVETVVSVASSTLGDQLQAGKHVIDREHEAVALQNNQVKAELQRLTDLVARMQAERAEESGRLSSGLEQALSATSALHNTTQSLRDALASPKSRGQWGERMAEDVLRAAGFVEGVNYAKQRQVDGGGLPDFTFMLPKRRMVHMDVKFPIDNYLRTLEATKADEKAACAKAFRRDVRLRVKELHDRAYIDPNTTVDYLLLFIPNESVYGFIHEHDPQLIDLAMEQKIVLCSPTSLFAVLAVIRQAVDNFMVDKRADDILASVAGLRNEWQKVTDSIDKIGRGLNSANKAYDDLSGTRSRQFEKQLSKVEATRDGRLSELSADVVDDRLVDPRAGRLELSAPEADGQDNGPLRQVV